MAKFCQYFTKWVFEWMSNSFHCLWQSHTLTHHPGPGLTVVEPHDDGGLSTSSYSPSHLFIISWLVPFHKHTTDISHWTGPKNQPHCLINFNDLQLRPVIDNLHGISSHVIITHVITGLRCTCVCVQLDVWCLVLICARALTALGERTSPGIGSSRYNEIKEWNQAFSCLVSMTRPIYECTGYGCTEFTAVDDVIFSLHLDIQSPAHCS